MSFEVYVDCFLRGESAAISRQRMLDAFGSFVTVLEPHIWSVQYDEINQCYIYMGEGQDEVDGAMISRPCGDLRLWDSLFAIMQLGNVVLYYPGCRTVMVASEEVVEHLPAEMLESLGGAVTVHSGSEILRRIQAD
jgi:hypothetical protein